MSSYYSAKVWVVGPDVVAVNTSTDQIDFDFTTITGAVIYDIVVDGEYVMSDVALTALTFDGTTLSGLDIANQSLAVGV